MPSESCLNKMKRIRELREELSSSSENVSEHEHDMRVEVMSDDRVNSNRVRPPHTYSFPSQVRAQLASVPLSRMPPRHANQNLQQHAYSFPNPKSYTTSEPIFSAKFIFCIHNVLIICPIHNTHFMDRVFQK